jgi:hypothetical protein
MRSDDGSWLPVWTYAMDPYPLGQMVIGAPER